MYGSWSGKHIRRCAMVTWFGRRRKKDVLTRVYCHRSRRCLAISRYWAARRLASWPADGRFLVTWSHFRRGSTGRRHCDGWTEQRHVVTCSDALSSAVECTTNHAGSSSRTRRGSRWNPIQEHSSHVLHQLLPDRTQSTYNLRSRNMTVYLL